MPRGDLKSALSRLPAARQIELHERVELRAWTTLRVGGPADLMVRCTSEVAVLQVLELLAERGLSYFVMGAGSNLVICDQGLRPPVITLGGELAQWEVDLDGVEAGGGANLTQVCRAVARAGLSGLERLLGVPGSIGGAVVMNAGAYGVEIFDLLEWAKLAGSRDGLRMVAGTDIDHGYRWSELTAGDDIVVRARLALESDDLASINQRIREVNLQRRQKLPPGTSAGSVFKNPEGDYAGRLLEACGCKSLRCGGAQVSERHANVIVSSRGATASDILVLARQMRARVRETFNIELDPEVRFIDEQGRRIPL
ncbi:MAG: UDP-N-acetylmuramate dehydrogenase [Acidobacteria bacterium]|jgi:UDP-N-acetylmuramate dehydrogenase|nr:UDP-N-acetylmuramate dehydrogenase [Acidobacteriota bacterium]